MPTRDWLLLIECLITLPLVVLALRSLGFRRVLAAAARHGGSRHGGPAARPEIVLGPAAVAMARASRILRMGTCLTRALGLTLVLHRRGVPTTLRIGVDKQSGHLAAHAWLEHAGQQVGAPSGRSFGAVFALPGAARA